MPISGQHDGLRNEYWNSLLMTCYYLNLSSNCDWMKQILLAVRQMKSATQIWVVTRHQYGISKLVPQTSFRGKASGGVAKCRMFSQPTANGARGFLKS